MSEAETCPLCDGPNGCGLAAGRSHCWCFEIAIPADILARVPEADRSLRCVCQSCATAPVAASEPRRT